MDLTKRVKSNDNVKDRMVWIDCEMSGLNIENDKLLEIACIVTDTDLNILEPGIDIVIHEPDELLDGMDKWCTEHHAKSGLTDLVKKSAVSCAQAEQQVLEYVKRNGPKGLPLCGNSVHADRIFLQKYMPELNAYLHYRIIDVSSVKELSRRWYPEVMEEMYKGKRGLHRALDDIEDSINELLFYRNHIFKGEDIVSPALNRKTPSPVEEGMTAQYNSGGMWM